jgi:hypothetical protein
MYGHVLKSNGTYQHISMIKKGDYVMNMTGNPVCVKRVIEVRNKSGTNMHFGRNENWYDEISCNDETEILLEEGGFTKIKDLEEQCSYTYVLPEHLCWDLPDKLDHVFGDYKLMPSYSLGFLFGAFIALGETNKYRGVLFNCSNLCEHMTNRIDHHFDIVFKKQLLSIFIIFGETQRQELTCIDDDIAEIFEEMVTKDNDRFLPKIYWCSNKDYLRGLREGIIHCYIGQVKQMREEDFHLLFMISLSINNDDRPKTGDIRVHKRKVKGISRTWKLETECPQNTCIANNMVVRT